MYHLNYTIIISIFLIIFLWFSFHIETFLPYKDYIDKVGSNNALPILKNSTCNMFDKSGGHPFIDCNNNFKYIKYICNLRNDNLCNSLVGYTPRPQNSHNPSNFKDF